MPFRPFKRFGRVFRDRSGAIAIMTAAALPILIGILGISIDIGVWYWDKRAMQTAADTAVVAAALDAPNWPRAQASARYLSELNGYPESNLQQFVFNSPPQSGPLQGDPNAIEVILRKSGRQYFSRLFAAAPTLEARAVTTFAKTCLYVMDKTMPAALSVSGNVEVTVECGVKVNSTAADGLKVSSSNGCLRAQTVEVVGGYSGTCVSPTPRTGIAQFEDPLLKYPTPEPAKVCDSATNPYLTRIGSSDVIHITGSATLNPGTYCHPLKIASTANLTLNPGNYIFVKTGIEIEGQATIKGSDVMIYFAGQSKDEVITMSGQANITLSGRKSGPWAGMLLYHNRSATSGVMHTLTGQAAMSLDGAVYLPTQSLRFAGGATAGVMSLVMVVKNAEFVGHSRLAIQPNSVATLVGGIGRVTLAE